MVKWGINWARLGFGVFLASFWIARLIGTSPATQTGTDSTNFTILLCASTILIALAFEGKQKG